MSVTFFAIFQFSYTDEIAQISRKQMIVSRMRLSVFGIVGLKQGTGKNIPCFWWKDH